MTARNKLAASAVFMASMVMLSGCSLDDILAVHVPGKVLEEALDNAALADVLSTGVVAEVECSWNQYVAGAAHHSGRVRADFGEPHDEELGTAQDLRERFGLLPGHLRRLGVPHVHAAAHRAVPVGRRGVAAERLPGRGGLQPGGTAGEGGNVGRLPGRGHGRGLLPHGDQRRRGADSRRRAGRGRAALQYGDLPGAGCGRSNPHHDGCAWACTGAHRQGRLQRGNGGRRADSRWLRRQRQPRLRGATPLQLLLRAPQRADRLPGSPARWADNYQNLTIGADGMPHGRRWRPGYPGQRQDRRNAGGRLRYDPVLPRTSTTRGATRCL